MKVTKYPQSCLVLEGEGRICIDLGTIATAGFSVDDLGYLDAVLFTHQHADHFDADAVRELVDRGIPIYGNADVISQLSEGGTEVYDGGTLDVAGFTVTPRDLPHMEMVDGSPGPPNTGFLINEAFFHPGDGLQLTGLSVDCLAVPIAGPSASFRDAYRMVESTGAKTVLPMHYDFFLADPHLFEKYCALAEVRVLAPGTTIEL